MSGFTEALENMGAMCAEEFAGEVRFNGHTVQGITATLKVQEPLEMGGFHEIPRIEVSIARADYEEFRHPDASMGRDRVIAGGKTMRVVGVVDDPQCPWVRLECDSLDG